MPYYSLNDGASSGGVTSVNGQTGDVVLAIPTKTSDLTNDSGFTTYEPTGIKLSAPANTLSWGYRNSIPQTILLDIDFPNGIKITSIVVTCNKADPAVELSAQLKSADINTTGSFPATNIATIATVNTTTGNYSQIGMSTTVATGKRLYLQTTADVYDVGTMWFLNIIFEVL